MSSGWDHFASMPPLLFSFLARLCTLRETCMESGTVVISLHNCSCLAFCLLLAASPAHAQDQQESLCRDSEAASDARIDACTALINGAVYTDLKDYALTHLNRGEALHESGNAQQALADLETALDYDPYLYPGYMLRGYILLTLREPYRAIADFSVAAGLNPLDAAPYAKRGLALFAHREFGSAIQDLETALGHDPAHTDARRTLAWILSTAPDRDMRDGMRALDLLDQVSAPPDLLVLAAAQAEAGRPIDAIVTYRRLTAESPGATSLYQSYLATLGFFSGTADGTYSDELEAAIRRCLDVGCRIGAPKVAE